MISYILIALAVGSAIGMFVFMYKLCGSLGQQVREPLKRNENRNES